MKNTYLVTGAAGFIGFYLCERLLRQGEKVIGVDNLNNYYSVALKKTRLSLLEKFENFVFFKIDISQKKALEKIFSENQIDYVINLAAQAGVRYSIDNPDKYIKSNIVGFYNILEICRHNKVKHLVFASSSSVYGSNEKVPFEETDFVDHPVSLYAATKKSNELMAYTYSHLYNIPTTGLRFFTVYGPLGRPDMAYFNFTSLFFQKKAIKVYNNGNVSNDLSRDFTYVADIVEGIIKVLGLPPNNLMPKYRVLNIGNEHPEKLMVFIETLEKCLSTSLKRRIEFKKEFLPLKPGDVPATYASTKALENLSGFKPCTSLNDGLQKFTDWYVSYYNKR